MLKIIFKIVGLAIICFIGFLPLNFHEVQAQQKTAPISINSSSTDVSIEFLKLRRSAIEAMVDIDATAKTDAISYIDQAVSHLDLTENTKRKSAELSQFIQLAPKRLADLQEELKKTLNGENYSISLSQKMTTPDLEQKVRQIDADFAESQKNFKKWESQLTAEKNAINQIPEIMVSKTSRQKEIQLNLEKKSGVTETEILEHARILFLKTELAKLNAEIDFNDHRQRSHSLLVELFRAEKDMAQKIMEDIGQGLKTLQVDLQNRRLKEAAQTSLEAQDATLTVPLQPKVVQEQFDINIKLSADLETITEEEARLLKKYNEYQNSLETLEEEFETARKRVELDILTEVIGLALRSQRLNLPAANQYIVDTESYQIRMSEISEKQIELNRLMRDLSDMGTLIDTVIKSINLLSDKDKKALEIKLRDVVNGRLDIITKSKSGYDRLIKLIQDIEFTKKKLVSTAEEFGELLDRHLLWTKSSKPVGINDIHRVKIPILWIINPDNWILLLKDTGQTFFLKPFSWILSALAVFLLFFSRHWARKNLKEIADRIDNQKNDSLLLTINALGLTILLAAAWPFLFGITAVQLKTLPTAELFTASIINGLTFASVGLMLFLLFYYVCRPDGLAQKHFQWPESVRKTLINNLVWLIPIDTLSEFLLGAMEAIPEYQYSDSLAKLAIMIQTLSLSIFIVLTLRFKGGITSILIDKHSQNWLCRLRHIWYPLAVLSPLCITWLAVSGYYYSAVEIHIFGYQSLALFLALAVLNNLALRALVLTRRRIISKNAMDAQPISPSPEPHRGGSKVPEKESPAPLMETIAEMNESDEQTRSLLKLVVIGFTLLGIWTIWEPVFPAFGILEDVQFWSYTTLVNGIQKTVPITLANVIIAIVVIFTTWVSVRNLPGLLEVVLLNRLPLDPGARYAYSTVSRYVITAIGIFIALNTIGVHWGELQWLVAALSVGIGFGLQEIVANFISGLIVLFERPFRVGDTVTVGEISGTVKRIQIRATTIEDWDRKELIVPNKDFITGTLLNWSLSDKVVRIKVPVGIAYGSDTDLAEKLMYKAIKSNSLVLKSPRPRVVFLGFGDNTLNFEARVFVENYDDYIPMLHEINRAIDKEFRQNGITIAFPQRDVHLDTSGPLDIRMVPSVAPTPEIDTPK